MPARSAATRTITTRSRRYVVGFGEPCISQAAPCSPLPFDAAEADDGETLEVDGRPSSSFGLNSGKLIRRASILWRASISGACRGRGGGLRVPVLLVEPPELARQFLPNRFVRGIVVHALHFVRILLQVE